MDLSTETLPISFQDRNPMFANYDDTTNVESRSFLRKAIPIHPGHNEEISSLKDISPGVENAGIIKVHGDTKNVRYSANEMVNVCYAKICCRRSQAFGVLEDENERFDDCTMDQVFPSYFEKDLDKLRKLRLKSKLKTKKSKERAEVKKWIETPEKFISVLKDIRLDKGSDGEHEVVNTDVEASADNSTEKTVSSFPGKKETKNQVHFPEHVLLCGALQEHDVKEVESIINNYKIDLNSLICRTGYYYLHKTITNDQLNCAKILIQKGIDVNAKDSEGISPITLAFRSMNFQMVALLVDCGVNLSEYTKFRISELEKVKELSRSVSKVFEMDL